MANEEQVTLLKQGSEVWNAWRKNNSAIQIDLFSANLVDANLVGANLLGANLVGANLVGANLSNADLSFAYLVSVRFDSSNLNGASFLFSKMGGARLSGANLIGANLSNTDLSIANLSGANLSNADLSYTSLGANLSGANLNNANLVAAQVLRTNFKHAILTGACIQDWQIGGSTILENVKCDYIFRTYDLKQEFSGRLPVDPANTFAPGEFTQRFQIIASALETIDITFTEGIDWQAFFQAFQDLRAIRPNEDISIQGMERKGDAFVVRLEVEGEVDKAAIETEVKQHYAHQLAALEAQYQERLRLQSGEIATYRQTQSSLLHIVQTMAEKDSISQNFHGPVGNVAATNQGKMQAVQHNYAPEQQDLSEAAREIQALLNTLAETYNTTTDAGKEQLMKELGKEVKRHPKWRRALKAGGIELIKVLCAPIGVPLEMARVYLEDED